MDDYGIPRVKFKIIRIPITNLYAVKFYSDENNVVQLRSKTNNDDDDDDYNDDDDTDNSWHIYTVYKISYV